VELNIFGNLEETGHPSVIQACKYYRLEALSSLSGSLTDHPPTPQTGKNLGRFWQSRLFPPFFQILPLSRNSGKHGKRKFFELRYSDLITCRYEGLDFRLSDWAGKSDLIFARGTEGGRAGQKSIFRPLSMADRQPIYRLDNQNLNRTRGGKR
jgi:hypothetical protein